MAEGAARLGRKGQRTIDAIIQAARTFGEKPRPILEEIVPSLRELLDTEMAGAYRASPAGPSSTWQLDVFTGFSDRFRVHMVDFFATTKGLRPLYPGYDALTPEPDQRNVVRHPSAEIPESVYRPLALWQRVMEPAGIGGDDQMRVLLCDGPVLLAWVGGVRRRRFTGRERTVLTSLIAPLRARLSLERRLLCADLHEKGLAAAMDLAAETLVLCTREGRVAHASPAARARLDSEQGLRSRVQAALRGCDVPGMTLLSLQVPGLPEHVLVALGRLPATESFATKLRAASEAWGLTPRQAQVLARVVRGDSNKQIADRLRCAENTIEVHVSALLRKSRAQGRAALAVEFWTSIAG